MRSRNVATRKNPKCPHPLPWEQTRASQCQGAARCLWQGPAGSGMQCWRQRLPLPTAPSTIPIGTSMLGAGGAGAWPHCSEQPWYSVAEPSQLAGKLPSPASRNVPEGTRFYSLVTGNMNIAGVVGTAWLITALTPPQGAAEELESTSTGDFDSFCCFSASLPGSDVGRRDAPFLSSGPGSTPWSGSTGRFPVSFSFGIKPNSPNLEPFQ